MDRGPGAAAPDRGTRLEMVREAFEQRYPAYQYHFVEFLTEHLADVSRVFGGDLQEVMVLAIVGQVFLRAHREVSGRAQDNGPLEAAISASRIADVTGIPRQTVRRKLQSLEKRGWIERTPSGAYRLVATGGVSAARRDLEAVDRRAIDRMARLFCGLERLMASPLSPG